VIVDFRLMLLLY